MQHLHSKANGLHLWKSRKAGCTARRSARVVCSNTILLSVISCIAFHQGCELTFSAITQSGHAERQRLLPRYLAGRSRAPTPVWIAGSWPANSPSGSGRGLTSTATVKALPFLKAQPAPTLVQKFWASGIGKVLLAAWVALSPYPPFSWIVWVINYILGLPKVWKWYLVLSLGQSLASWLVPGIYSQIVTGTWLGILKSVSPGIYCSNMAMRVLQLFKKQASLRGDQLPPPGPQQLSLLSDELKQNPTLANALSAVPVLGMWHKLEKTPFTDPELLASLPPTSQAKWALLALEGLYGEQAKASGKDVTAQAQAAETALKSLSDAVTTAARRRQCGVLESNDGSILAAVEKAGDEAVSALTQLRAAGVDPSNVQPQTETAWQNKLKELRIKFGQHPGLLAELDRLA